MLAVALPMHSAVDVDIQCFAVELEEDIARLEAEANRDELVTFTFLKECMDAAPYTSDVDMQDQNTHMSDAGSDDECDEREQAEVAKIRANARLVSQCGQTLQPGAWRGCCKSPWCDREDRHRGLCNHKATIAGPASRPEPASTEEQDTEVEEEGQDASTVDEGGCDVAGCSDRAGHSDDEQQVSGGHSNNCHTPEACTRGDEREVASALQTGGSLQGVDHQHSSSQAQLQQHVAAAGLPAPLQRCSTAEEDISQDLLWGGNAGQLAAAELFNLAPAFQPRVKDLTSPGGTCLLGMDSLCNISSPLTMPLATHTEEAHVAAAMDTTSSDYSDHSHVKGSAHTSGASAPSSPSCASASATAADLAAFGPFKPAVMDAAASEAAASPAAVQEAQPAAYSPESAFTAIAATPSACELGDAEAAAAEATAIAVAAAAAAAAAAAGEVAEAATVTPLAGSGLSSTCAQAALEQAAAEGAAAEAVAAAAAAAALVTSGLSSAAAMDASLGAVQRPPRIKSKPSNSLMKAAAMLEGPASPKSKKRPASRMGSSGGHCCSQCGAVSTPVWRAGPAGPKTLCNACGVRYMKVAKRK